MARHTKAAALVGGGHETEEQLMAGSIERREAELVHDHKIAAQQAVDELAHGVGGEAAAVQRLYEGGGSERANPVASGPWSLHRGALLLKGSIEDDVVAPQKARDRITGGDERLQDEGQNATGRPRDDARLASCGAGYCPADRASYEFQGGSGCGGESPRPFDFVEDRSS